MLVWSFATCLELPLPLKELSAKHKSATKPQRLKKNTIEKILKFSNTQGKLVILLPPKKGGEGLPRMCGRMHTNKETSYKPGLAYLLRKVDTLEFSLPGKKHTTQQQ